MGRVGWIGAAALLCSCVTTTDVVRSRFAKEQSCPEDQVRVDEAGGAQYRARGCDKETIYVCDHVAAFKGGVECVQQGLPNPPAYRERAPPVLPPPDPGLPPPK
jgi:hypothetical protein